MKGLFFALSILSTLTAAYAGHEAGANGHRVSGWFTANGVSLINRLVDSKKSGRDLLPPDIVDKLSHVTDALVVCNDSASWMKDTQGNLKDIRVDFDTDGKPTIQLNCPVWTMMMELNQPDFRMILHGYLYAAGLDDREYQYSGRLNFDSVPVAHNESILGLRGDMIQCIDSWPGYYSVDYLLTVVDPVDDGMRRPSSLSDSLAELADLIDRNVPEWKRRFTDYTALVFSHDYSQSRVWEPALISGQMVPNSGVALRIPAPCHRLPDSRVEFVRAVEALDGTLAGSDPNQIVYRYSSELVEKKGQVPPLQQSMTVVHEWLREIQGNWERVRKINHLIHSREFAEESAGEIRNHLRSIGVPLNYWPIHDLRKWGTSEGYSSICAILTDDTVDCWQPQREERYLSKQVLKKIIGTVPRHVTDYAVIGWPIEGSSYGTECIIDASGLHCQKYNAVFSTPTPFAPILKNPRSLISSTDRFYVIADDGVYEFYDDATFAKAPFKNATSSNKLLGLRAMPEIGACLEFADKDGIVSTECVHWGREDKSFVLKGKSASFTRTDRTVCTLVDGSPNCADPENVSVVRKLPSTWHDLVSLGSTYGLADMAGGHPDYFFGVKKDGKAIAEGEHYEWSLALNNVIDVVSNGKGLCFLRKSGIQCWEYAGGFLGTPQLLTGGRQ